MTTKPDAKKPKLKDLPFKEKLKDIRTWMHVPHGLIDTGPIGVLVVALVRFDIDPHVAYCLTALTITFVLMFKIIFLLYEWWEHLRTGDGADLDLIGPMIGRTAVLIAVIMAIPEARGISLELLKAIVGLLKKVPGSGYLKALGIFGAGGVTTIVGKGLLGKAKAWIKTKIGQKGGE